MYVKIINTIETPVGFKTEIFNVSLIQNRDKYPE